VNLFGLRILKIIVLSEPGWWPDAGHATAKREGVNAPKKDAKNFILKH
jgi:hypothetical protein